MDKENIREKIKSVIAEAEPYVTGHGGHISFVDWEEDTGRVLVSLQGGVRALFSFRYNIKIWFRRSFKKRPPPGPGGGSSLKNINFFRDY